MQKRTFTEQETTFILESFEKDKNANKIAKFFNVTHKVIKRALGEHGIIVESTCRKCSSIDDERIKEEYRQNGGNARSISIKLNLPLTRTTRVLKKMGVQLTNRALSDETENQIVDMYTNNGLDSTQIGKFFNISSSLVCGVLERNGIKRRKINKISIDREQEVIENFLSNPSKSMTTLGKEYGVNYYVIQNILNKHKIDREIRHQRTHIFNEHAFKVIDKDVAWLLGWIWSDGNLAGKKTNFSISVHRQDNEVFQKFAQVLDAKSFAHDKRKDQLCDTFRLASKYAYKDLLKLGCVPKKSLIINWPRHDFSLDCLCAFLRGLYEGDGSYSQKALPSGQLSLSSASHSFLLDVNKKLNNYFNISNGTIDFATGGFEGSLENGSLRLRHSQFKNVYKLLCYFYENGNCKHYLERKYQDFMAIKAYFETSRKYSPKFLLRNAETNKLYYCWGHKDVMKILNNEFSWKQVDIFLKKYDSYHENRKKLGLTKPGIPSHWQLIQELEKQQILAELGSFRDILVE